MAVVSEVPRFVPRWPDLEDLPKGKLRFVYDRLSDTLFVDFYGEARPASSEPLDEGDRDYLFVRVDPHTDEVVGLQIETFRAYALKRHPYLVEALDIADLQGFSDIEAADIRRWAHEQVHEAMDDLGLIGALERLGA